VAQSPGPTEPKWGRPSPLPWPAGQSLVYFQKPFDTHVKGGRWSTSVMPKVGAVKKLGRAAGLTSGLPEPHFRSKHRHNHPINTPVLLLAKGVKKVAHFILVKTTYSGAKLVELYMSRIMCLHGVSKNIVLGIGSQFTSKFCEKLHESIDTKLNFSSAYHPQTVGQTERTNQVLEDMLRACALKYGKSWNKSLPYTKFSYNNSCKASIEMALFEALYG
jgi:hypothetical protein